MTIRDQIAAARQRLVAAGIDTAEAGRDASLLARHMLEWDRATLLLHQGDAVPAAFLGAYDAAIARRVKREPVAYIRGCQEFWSRDFIVSPAVLIPRPETELIIEIALKVAAASDAVSSVCDVGTGSGALAVTLAAEWPRVRVTATDISAAALAVARQNAAAQGVDDRIDLLEGAYFAEAARPFDLIVCNPPYVSNGDYQTLAPEVRDYEPRIALSAGSDGLRDIREVLARAPERLGAAGILLIEIGHDQAESVTKLVADEDGLELLDIQTDLQRIPRVAVIQKK